MKSILVADKDKKVVAALADIIKNKGTFFQVLQAYTGTEATEIISSFRVDIVITGLQMTEMDGFELLAWVNGNYPKIKVIVMADAQSSMTRAKVEKLGAAIVLEKPLDIGILTEKLFAEVQVSFGGQVRGISLSSFLQMMELEEKTCILEISRKQKMGWLFVRDGELIDAETGDRNGVGAALEILAWEKIAINIDYSPAKRKRAIDQQLMNLLMESKRIQDEKRAGGKKLRKYERVECLVSIDCDLEDWSYLSVVRDISLGGAYIETDQPAKKDQEIILSLSTQNPERHCRITAKVVRRDARGIGVKFKLLTLLQSKMIKDLLEKGSLGG